MWANNLLTCYFLCSKIKSVDKFKRNEFLMKYFIYKNMCAFNNKNNWKQKRERLKKKREEKNRKA